MNKKIIFLILIALPFTASAVDLLNGEGLFYTQPAQVNQIGQYNLTLYERAFFNFDDNGPGRQSNTTVNLNYGLLKKLELDVTQVLYMDNYKFALDKIESVIPGQTYFHLKFANWKVNLGNRPLLLGLLVTSSYRTTDLGDIYLETPYTGAGIEGGFQLLASYYANPEYIEESPACHLNLGFKNLNDAEEIMKSTQEIPFSLAFVNSTLKREPFLEAHGSIFVERAYPGYSNTSYMYLSPGYKHKINDRINLAVSLDIRIFAAKPDFVYNDLPAYSAYRLNFAVTGLFNKIRYAGPKQLKELDQAEKRALKAEQDLQSKQLERMDLEKKVEQQNREKQEKQDELDNLKNKSGK